MPVLNFSNQPVCGRFRSVSSCFLAGLILFSEKFTEAVELSLPCGAVIANPLLEKSKSGGLDAAGSYAAQLFGVHQPSFFENLQMLRDSCERDAERLCETRYRHRSAGEMVEDRTARRVPECVEQAIDLLRRCRHRGFDSRFVG